MRKLALTGVLALTLANVGHAEISAQCKVHPNTEYEQDEFTGRETATLDDRKFAGGAYDGVRLWPNFRITLSVDGDGYVDLYLTYADTAGADWFFISDRSPLRTLSHGHVYSQDPISGKNRDQVGSAGSLGALVFEQQWYTVDPTAVRAWLADPETKFRITGRNGYTDRSMKPKMYRILLDWARACLPPEYLPIPPEVTRK